MSSNWSKLDLYSLVYPVLANLCTYPGHLDRQAQVREEETGGREIGKSVGCCIASLLNFCLAASSGMQSGGRADWQECSDVRLRSLHLLPGVAGHNDQVAPVSVLCIQVERILPSPQTPPSCPLPSGPGVCNPSHGPSCAGVSLWPCPGPHPLQWFCGATIPLSVRYCTPLHQITQVRKEGEGVEGRGGGGRGKGRAIWVRRTKASVSLLSPPGTLRVS